MVLESKDEKVPTMGNALLHIGPQERRMFFSSILKIVDVFPLLKLPVREGKRSVNTHSDEPR
jgi:hypothetical protein